MKRVRLNMVQLNAFSLISILKILILSPSVSSDAMEDISSLNESDSFDFSSIITTTSACEVQKTCKGQISCSSCARIEWHQRPPYILKQTHSTQFAAFSPMTGILDFILQVMMTLCCGSDEPSCWDLKYKENPASPNSTIPMEQRADIFIPIVVGDFSIATHVALLPPSGIAFVVPKLKPGAQASSLLTAVLEIWPLVILTVMLCVLSGIVIWALDCRANRAEFPTSFSTGVWEGFWWAFISMSTVGYGDRTPKSTQGRIFSVIWILTGIGIFSIFTASLATSLTTISLDSKKSLPGSKVAVLYSSVEEIVGMQNQAKVKRFNSVEDILKALDDGEVEGALLDNYLYRYYQTFFPDNEFKVQEVIQYSSPEYGAIINNTKLGACFRQVRYVNQSSLIMTVDAALDFMDNTAVKPELPSSRKARKESFLPGDAIFILMYSAIAIVFILVLIGVTVEYFFCGRKKHLALPKVMRRNENGGVSSKQLLKKRSPITAESIEQLQEKITTELHQMFDSWKSQLRDLENEEIATPV